MLNNDVLRLRYTLDIGWVGRWSSQYVMTTDSTFLDSLK
jgi:hypothetical protein